MFPKLRILRIRAGLAFSKIVKNWGSIYSHLRSSNNDEPVSFHPGNKNSFSSVHRKIIVARYIKCSQGEMKHALHWFEDLKWL